MSTAYPLRLPLLVAAATVLASVPAWALRLDPSDKRFYYPLPEVVPFSSSFGWRVHPVTGARRFHSGVDLAAPAGLSVQAAHSGTVVFAGWRGGYGNAVIVRYPDEQYETLYGHLSAILVRSGQIVSAKQTIGSVGSTGLSTGPHLHFELRRFTGGSWVAVNAGSQLQAVEAYVNATPVAQSSTPAPPPAPVPSVQEAVPDPIALSFELPSDPK